MRKKIKTFRPFKIPRYLPGQVETGLLYGDLRAYNEHRKKVFYAKPEVDDKPLPMKLSNYLNNQRMLEDGRRLIQIDKDNKELIKRINLTNRMGGRVDTFNPVAYAYKSTWRRQELKMREIVRDNKTIYKTIMKTEASYPLAKMEEFWKHVVQKLNHSCKFPLLVLAQKSVDQIVREQPPITCEAELLPSKPSRRKPDRPKCFMDFRVREGVYLGRIIIELFPDYVPVTVQNFLSICCKETNLTYDQCSVHRVAPGQYIATGDITLGNGKGGHSIYGKTFAEEKHTLKHTKLGVLSATRVGNLENNSQFYISLTPMAKLDDENVVFGHVVRGNKTLCKINDLGRKYGRPVAPVIICDSGKFVQGITPIVLRSFKY